MDDLVGAVTVRLPFRPPLDHRALLNYLAARAVPGVEEVDATTYRRTLRLPHGAGIAEVRLGAEPSSETLETTLRLEDLRDVPAAVEGLRRLLDLDTDPGPVDAHLRRDPLLEPWVARSPGRRSPGTVDGAELAVRAVLGQQVSVAAARTLAARLVARLGAPLAIEPQGSLTHLFPDLAAVASAHDDDLPAMPASRRRTLRALAVAGLDGSLRLDGGAERDDVRRLLLAVPGIGPWTAGYIGMRALGDPDTFLPTDLAVRTALRRLGAVSAPADAARLATAWAPWRSYAVHHLWATLTASVPAPTAPDPEA